MKLYDLQVGQRFEFIDKHRGKVFEVTHMSEFIIKYKNLDIGSREHVAYLDSNYEVVLIGCI